MNEDKEGATQPTTKESSKHSAFRNFLKRFSRSKEAQQVNFPPEGLPSEELSPVNTPEVESEPTKNAKTSEVSEAIEPEEIHEPEKEKLKSINRIFFHTTPTRNLHSIIRRGLIGEKGHPSIGRELMYLLAFPDEFNEPTSQRYLLARKKRIEDLLRKRLPAVNIDAELAKTKQTSLYGNMKLWGGNEGYKLLVKVKEKTGIGLP